MTPVTVPSPLVVAGARERIRAAGRRVAVLDDDPTGSQTVHGATVITALDAFALDDTTFLLTNTRSLPEDEAAALTFDVARRVFELDPSVELVSRSDSTLRGHVLAE